MIPNLDIYRSANLLVKQHGEDTPKVLGPDHSVIGALARASITMDRVDLWHARLALKMLRRGAFRREVALSC